MIPTIAQHRMGHPCDIHPIGLTPQRPIRHATAGGFETVACLGQQFYGNMGWDTHNPKRPHHAVYDDIESGWPQKPKGIIQIY